MATTFITTKKSIAYLSRFFSRKIFFPIILLFITIYSAKSQTADWSTSIASILYKNCTDCHHEGAIAPFSLMTYDDAIAQAFSIQIDVNTHKMPPWPPDPNYSHLREEKVLSQNDISKINDWVNNGMPLGDTTLAPPKPVYNGASVMSVIDDTLQFPAYTIPVPGDYYRAFLVHSGYTTTKYINQVEILPSNSAIVHHLFFFHDPTNTSYLADLADTGVGFYGGFLNGFSNASVIDAGYVPGSGIFRLPPNMGEEVPPGSDFIVNIHFAPGSQYQTDSIKVHIKWCDMPDSQVRKVHNYRYLHWHVPSLLNPPFQMPPDEISTFYEASDTFTKDMSLITLQPHMHLIGKSFEIYMLTPNGDTTRILYIPQWYFSWQMAYFLTKIMKIPAGSRIYGTGVYDNTSNNPNNPSNPPQWVYAGESTYDEMMSCRFDVMDYLPGDENIILDSSFYYATGNTNSINTDPLSLNVFPNPASGQIHFVTWLPAQNVFWTLTNVDGLVVKSVNEKRIVKGQYAQEFDVSNLPSGMYLLTIQSGAEKATRKVMVMK